MQVRSRNCSGDFPCPLENGVGSRAEKPCFLGKCAYWSDWLEWSSCSESCGNSTRVRSRQCLGNYNFDQGCPLTGSFTEDEFCNLGVCPYWSIWENWGACSASCGNGTQSRIRECLGDFLSELCDAFGNRLETKVSCLVDLMCFRISMDFCFSTICFPGFCQVKKTYNESGCRSCRYKDQLSMLHIQDT